MKKQSPKYLLINGTSGDDFLVGTFDADTIYGFEGNDTLIGGEYHDILYGGPGDDIYGVESPADIVHELVGEGFDKVYTAVSYTLGTNDEIEMLALMVPTSTAGFTLTGNKFGQTIIGSAGDDLIDGGRGTDVMAGLQGHDEYRVFDAGDVVLENDGDGEDWVFVDASLRTYNLTEGSEIERVYVMQFASTIGMSFGGNEYDNELSGAAGPDQFFGRGGNDTMAGGIGSDVYRVEDLGDVIVEAEVLSNPGDIDAVYVSMHLGSYTLADTCVFGLLQVEVLAAIDPSSTGVFNLTGNILGNTIFGSAGQNTLIGGGGNDTLVGYGGNDFYRVEQDFDQVIETAGNGFDSVYAVFTYVLAAGTSVEVLAAFDSVSTAALDLTANEFANEVYGSAGANRLDGRAGTDLLYGYGGADVFAFTKADKGDVDTIGDFAAGTDKIGLDDALFNGIGTPGAPSANAFVFGTAAADSDDRIIYDSATGQLLYDADGSGSGAAYQFALVVGAPVLALSDFAVI